MPRVANKHATSSLKKGKGDEHRYVLGDYATLFETLACLSCVRGVIPNAECYRMIRLLLRDCDLFLTKILDLGPFETATRNSRRFSLTNRSIRYRLQVYKVNVVAFLCHI